METDAYVEWASLASLGYRLGTQNQSYRVLQCCKRSIVCCSADSWCSLLARTTTLMSGHLRTTFGNNKWSNYNEQTELSVAWNGRQKVGERRSFHRWSSRVILENKFAIGSSDKNVAICYYETEQRFWAAEMIKKKPKSTVTCIAWHPNNQLLAVGSCDYRCRSVSDALRAKMFIIRNHLVLESTPLISKRSIKRRRRQAGVKSPMPETCYKNSNQVRHEHPVRLER